MATVPISALNLLAQSLMPESQRESQLLGGPPVFLMGGPQGPVYAPQGGGPQPGAGKGALKRFGRFLAGPEATTALSTAGLSLLQPNWLGPKAAIGNAIAQAMQAVALYGQQREAREERARAAGLQERETRVHEKSAETTAAAERSLAEHRIAEREATKQYHTEMLGLERKRLDAAYQERDFMQERYRLQLENEQRAIKAGLDTAIERERTRQMAMELHQLDVKVRRAALDVELEKLKQVNAEDPDIKLLERAVKVSETLAEQPPAQAYTSLLETEDILNLSAKSAKARTLALANAVEAFAVKMPPERAAAFRAKAAPLLQVQPTPPRPKSPAEGAVVEGPAQDRTTRLPIAGPQQNGIPGQTVPTTPPLAVGGPEPPPPAAPRAPQSSIGMRSSHPPGTVGRDKATGKLIMVRADGTWQPLQGKR